MLFDPDEAADATQEAFLSAYKAMSRFKGEGFRTWMLRIATNACLDILRSGNASPPSPSTPGASRPIPKMPATLCPSQTWTLRLALKGSALRAELGCDPTGSRYSSC